LRKPAPPADAAPSTEDGLMATNTKSGVSTKGDRLDVSYREGGKPVKSVVITPAETEPKPPDKTERIVSRHWHDPLDNRSATAAVQPASKPKLAKTSTDRPRVVSAEAPKP
jgi:hypothetical protein